MRSVFSNTLVDLAKKDDRICFITPDMGYSIMDTFKDTFPDRYFNLGIAEQNVIAVAAGMALSGLKPYVYSIVPFIVHRCLEQIRVNVSYMNTDIKIIGIGAGFEYGIVGSTHYGAADISIMRSLPNIEIYSPGDFSEMEQITRLSALHNKPAYIRIGRHNRGIINNNKIELGKASFIEEGKDIALIAAGNILPAVYDYAQELKIEGMNPTLISMHTIKPIDKDCILKLISDGYNKIYTFEEHTIMGGLGSAVAEIIAESGKAIEFKRIGINDEYSHYVGSADYIREQFKLDAKGLKEQCC